jgi:5,10-methylenetetrahydromethanopterin reductase
MSRPYSLGITFIPQFPPEVLVRFARKAEDSGFEQIWLYEDAFYAGAFTSAATLLAATDAIQVGIGILPATVRNPLYAAMEISTLARIYPGRFIAGFGHGFEPWIKQIGAYPKSPLKALEETVSAVRSLLTGHETTLIGSHVHLDSVRLLHPPERVPPLYIGGVREKTLHLAGAIGDGTCLSVLSSPAYVRWARQHIAAGSASTNRLQHTCCVSVACAVHPESIAARKVMRKWLAGCIQEGGGHLVPIGIDMEARELFNRHGLEEGARKMPEDWVNQLSASGTPEQVVQVVKQLVDAGADSVVLAPVNPDPSVLDDIIRLVLPLL